MKQVFDKSKGEQPQVGLRHAYAKAQAKRPSEATLKLQRRKRHGKDEAPEIREFARIERGHLS